MAGRLAVARHAGRLRVARPRTECPATDGVVRESAGRSRARPWRPATGPCHVRTVVGSCGIGRGLSAGWRRIAEPDAGACAGRRAGRRTRAPGPHPRRAATLRNRDAGTCRRPQGAAPSRRARCRSGHALGRSGAGGLRRPVRTGRDLGGGARAGGLAARRHRQRHAGSHDGGGAGAAARTSGRAGQRAAPAGPGQKPRRPAARRSGAGRSPSRCGGWTLRSAARCGWTPNGHCAPATARAARGRVARASSSRRSAPAWTPWARVSARSSPSWGTRWRPRWRRLATALPRAARGGPPRRRGSAGGRRRAAQGRQARAHHIGRLGLTGGQVDVEGAFEELARRRRLRTTLLVVGRVHQIERDPVRQAQTLVDGQRLRQCRRRLDRLAGAAASAAPSRKATAARISSASGAIQRSCSRITKVSSAWRTTHCGVSTWAGSDTGIRSQARAVCTGMTRALAGDGTGSRE